MIRKPCKQHDQFIHNCDDCIWIALVSIEDRLYDLAVAGRAWAGKAGPLCIDPSCPECHFMLLLAGVERLFKEER